MKDIEIVELEYIEMDEAEEHFDDVFVFDGNSGAYIYSNNGDYYGVYTTEELEEKAVKNAISLEGHGQYLSCTDGFKYIFDFEPFEQGVEHGVILKEEDIHTIDGDLFLTNDEFDEKEIVHSIANVDFNTTIWAGYVYEIETIVFGTLFAVDTEGSSLELFETKEDAIDAILMDCSDIYIWHFGDNELKKIHFGDTEIEEIVELEGNAYTIVKSVKLEEPNPMYATPYVGIDDDGDIVFYSYNNCNVRTNDVPKVDYCQEDNKPLIFSNLSELVKSSSWDNLTLNDKKEILDLLE